MKNRSELTMNRIFEHYAFLKILATVYCDSGKESNHILGNEWVFR
jgi:hypothetical protein